MSGDHNEAAMLALVLRSGARVFDPVGRDVTMRVQTSFQQATARGTDPASAAKASLRLATREGRS